VAGNQLTDALYMGKVKHHGKVYAGEQPVILVAPVWQQANDLLGRPDGVSEQKPRNRQGALLEGIAGMRRMWGPDGGGLHAKEGTPVCLLRVPGGAI
jgi:hypothetical protein